MADVIVIGGGIAGLTAAWKLLQNGVDVLVVEEQDEAGGNIKTFAHRGYLLESGPHNFMGSAEFMWRLTFELAFNNMTEEASPAANKRYIFRDGRLAPLPTTFCAFIRTHLLSTRAKLRLMLEPFIRNGAQDDDTAWEFFCRRFGEEAATYIMSPFISGIYAGDVKTLGAKAAFPKFWNFEHESGSMVRGAWRFTRQKKKRLAKEGLTTRKGLFSYKGGLGQLTKRLIADLQSRIITNVAVQGIREQGKMKLVEAENWEASAPVVISAVPPNRAAGLLMQMVPGAKAPLQAIPMAPVALLHWSLEAKKSLIPQGFGFLMPRLYRLRVLGTLFPSQLFRDRAPEGYHSFASFYGGMTDPGAVELDDNALKELLFKEHETIFESPLIDPDLLCIMRYPGAIPQLLPVHPDAVSEVRKAVARKPGLFLAGNYLTGVGVEHAVSSGYDAAAQAYEFLQHHS